MAKLSIKNGSTSITLNLFIQDSTSSTGAGKTGLAYNTAGLTAYYVQPGAASTAIALATQTPTGAWASGGFAEIDSTNLPGLYRFDVPNAMLSGAKSVFSILKGTGIAPLPLEIELTVVDNQNANLGLTNLDAAVSTRSTFAGGAVASVTGSVGSVAGSVGSVTSPVAVGTNSDKSGYALAQGFPTNFAATVISSSGVVNANLVDWLGVAPATLNGGTVQATTSLGATAPSGWINSAAFASGATIPAVASVSGVVNANLTQVDGIAAYNSISWSDLLLYAAAASLGATQLIAPGSLALRLYKPGDAPGVATHYATIDLDVDGNRILIPLT